MYAYNNQIAIFDIKFQLTMNYRLFYSANRYIFYRTILPQQLTIILFFIISTTLGQNIDSSYINKIKPGTTIYAITNRVVGNNNKPVYINQVRADHYLDYLSVTYYKPDSLITEKLDSTDFLKQISGINTDWLLFVHGDSKTFEQAVMRGYAIQGYHNVNVIVFSWPAKDYELNGIKNFNNSRKNVIASGNQFAELIRFMGSFKENNQAFNNGNNLSVFFHSLGNLFIKNQAFKENNNEYNLIFDNLIINSAAVNQKNHKLWVEKLSFQNRIYITSNKSDVNLKGVRIFTKDGKQLGEKVKQPIAENAYYLNFSDAVGLRMPTGTTHTYFIGEVHEENRTIKSIYYNLFHGNIIDLSDTDTFKKRKDGVGYNIIKTN